MKIKPFIAFRPPAEIAATLASPPYDVVDTAEARAIAGDNPMCFLRISRSELELPAGTDPYSDAVYQRAADNFRRFQEQRYLVRDPEPSIYVYRQIMGSHQQTGVVTVAHADDYEADVIKKHEKTRQAPENDRTKHLHTVNANTGPVFLAYRDRPEIDRVVAEVCATSPLYDFTAPDGVRHIVWKANDPDRLVKLFAQVPTAYIADGHHRAKSGARVAAARRAANPKHTGAEEYNWFLAVLFPANQLRILPYNRCVLDLNGLTAEQFLAALRKEFKVAPGAAPEPPGPRHISMYLAGQWYDLSWAEFPAVDLAATLDVSVLQSRVLGPLLGIDDPRASKRIEFVGGIKGPDELKKRVDSGRAAVAFSMHPTRMEQLMAISDAGLIMPPKSTWFEPKLRSGLIVHPIV